MDKRLAFQEFNKLENLVINELGLYNSDTINFCKAIDLFIDKMITTKQLEKFTKNDFKLATKRTKNWLKKVKNN